MALFPLMTRTSSNRHRRRHLDWWPWLTFGLLLAAFLGLAADPTRDTGIMAGMSSAEGRSETPHLAKREPLRLVAASERRDNNTGLSWPDPVSGAIWHSVPTLPGCERVDVRPMPTCGVPAIPKEGFQPRAPPAVA